MILGYPRLVVGGGGGGKTGNEPTILLADCQVEESDGTEPRKMTTMKCWPWRSNLETLRVMNHSLVFCESRPSTCDFNMEERREKALLGL